LEAADAVTHRANYAAALDAQSARGVRLDEIVSRSKGDIGPVHPDSPHIDENFSRCRWRTIRSFDEIEYVGFAYLSYFNNLPHVIPLAS
jgi:hypothetical protein